MRRSANSGNYAQHRHFRIRCERSPLNQMRVGRIRFCVIRRLLLLLLYCAAEHSTIVVLYAVYVCMTQGFLCAVFSRVWLHSDEFRN